MGDPRWGATGAMLQLTPTSARISCAKSESGIEAVRSESLCDLPDLASSQPASPRQPTPLGAAGWRGLPGRGGLRASKVRQVTEAFTPHSLYA